jgi:hypothetical protein
VAFNRVMVVGIQAGDHEPGVASTGSHTRTALVGDNDLTPGLCSEVGRRAAYQTRANDQEINFAYGLRAVCLPVRYRHVVLSPCAAMINKTSRATQLCMATLHGICCPDRDLA